ncbi:class I SAM-dependent methyltransferase [Fluviispira vulneris]|uniref:class I SAM-dependent methyltransferase n=1 Tax=Fluviispira vulneris TaxID=2763012 RepID=UPI0016469420|nr:class I SAM-dependent methyltransferase [Fluviispira vulneris]
MAFLDTSDRFSGKAKDFAKYRPTYPDEIIKFLRDRYGFSSKSICAEIGAGTGKFTKLLLKNKCRVFAIEPNPEMRAIAENSYKKLKSYTSVDATSVNTTLKDKSVDFVFCAQSLHWFSNAETAAEMRRILKPRGKVVIVWNKKDYKKSAFMTGIHKVFIEDSIDFLSVKIENIEDEKILADLFPQKFEKFSIPTKQILNREELIGRMLSTSYAPPKDHPKYDRFMAETNRLFMMHQKDGKVEFLYETVAYVLRI